jgi:hypothetical protein
MLTDRLRDLFLLSCAGLALLIEFQSTPPVLGATTLPLLPEISTNPYEIWLSFEQHKGTGKVVLRHRFVKVIHIDKDRAMIGVV